MVCKHENRKYFSFVLFSHLLLQKKGIWSFASSTIRKICCSIWIIIYLVKTTCQNITLIHKKLFPFFHFQTKLPNDDVFEYCLEEQEEDNLVTCTRSSSRPTTSSTSTSSAQSSTKKRKSTAWTDWYYFAKHEINYTFCK